MTMNSKFLAAAGGLALSAMLAGVPSASAYEYSRDGRGDDRRFERDSGRPTNRPIVLPRVTAEGAAPSWWSARKQAVDSWRDKVANRYGYDYSKWWSARDKDVDCKKFADDDPVWDNYGRRSLERAKPRHYEPVTKCTVSAIPSRGWGFSYGWHGR